MLEHEYGVKPSQIEWVQGRADRMRLDLPPDIRITAAPPGAELSDMLERGEIDFLVTGNNPMCFRRGAPSVRRLFPNYRELERDYYRRTGIYPIMHTVVIRRDIYERHPWVALSLYRAFCAAKDRCYRLLLETGSPKASFGWLQAIIEEEQAVFGQDWYPYGVEQNRRSIEALLQFNYEQGLTPRRSASTSSSRPAPCTMFRWVRGSTFEWATSAFAPQLEVTDRFYLIASRARSETCFGAPRICAMICASLPLIGL